MEMSWTPDNYIRSGLNFLLYRELHFPNGTCKLKSVTLKTDTQHLDLERTESPVELPRDKGDFPINRYILPQTSWKQRKRQYWNIHVKSQLTLKATFGQFFNAHLSGLWRSAYVSIEIIIFSISFSSANQAECRVEVNSQTLQRNPWMIFCNKDEGLRGRRRSLGHLHLIGKRSVPPRGYPSHRVWNRTLRATRFATGCSRHSYNCSWYQFLNEAVAVEQREDISSDGCSGILWSWYYQVFIWRRYRSYYP